jgi:hypothetical protein
MRRSEAVILLPTLGRVMTVQELADRIAELVIEAREPLPERVRPLGAQDFVDLWRGDRDCEGYAHVLLAHEVLKRRKYADVGLLYSAFYPGLASTEIPETGKLVLDKAFEYFDTRRKAEAEE